MCVRGSKCWRDIHLVDMEMSAYFNLSNAMCNGSLGACLKQRRNNVIYSLQHPKLLSVPIYKNSDFVININGALLR